MIDARAPAGYQRYTTTAILFHWVIGLLIIANIIIGLFHDSLLKGTINLHKSIGILVLGLSILRLGWRLAHRMPPLPETVKMWERRLAKAGEGLFYLLMIGLPLSGWIFTSASAKPHPLSFFGLFAVPALPVPPTRSFAGPWHQGHVLTGYAFGVLILIHISAALKHRFIDRDRTLDRMLPGAGPA